MHSIPTFAVLFLAATRAILAVPAPAPEAAFQELEARWGGAADYEDSVMQGDSWMKRAEAAEAAADLERRAAEAEAAAAVVEKRAEVKTRKVTKTSKVKYTVTKNHKPVVRTKTVKRVQTIRSTVQTTPTPTPMAAAKAVVTTRKVLSTQYIRYTVTKTHKPVVRTSTRIVTIDQKVTAAAAAAPQPTVKPKTVVVKQKVTSLRTIVSTVVKNKKPTRVTRVQTVVQTVKVTSVSGQTRAAGGNASAIASASRAAASAAAGASRSAAAAAAAASSAAAAPAQSAAAAASSAAAAASRSAAAAASSAAAAASSAAAAASASSAAAAQPTGAAGDDGGDDDGDSGTGGRFSVVGAYNAVSSALNTAPIALSGALTSVLATYGTGSPATSGTFLKNFGNGGSATAYQASGVLQKGGCDTGVTQYINDCYYLFLTGNETQMLGPGYPASQARQRTEIYTPGTPDGQKWHFTWKTYLNSTVTTANFFHLWQILSRGQASGPVVTFDVVGGQAILKDMARCPNGCASVPVASYAQRVIQHDMTIQYGTNGTMTYTANDFVTSANLINYSAWGYMGNVSTSLKFGSYRRAIPGIVDTSTFLGDFTAARLS